MPRRKLQFVQGAYYHLYNRGAGKQSIFRTDSDYQRALSLIKKFSAMLKISVIAYCLLPNHYHWLVRQDGDAPANLLPKRVFGSYSRTFNTVHHRTGTLFEDRFGAKLIDTDEYLRHLPCYIHGNPVRHGIAMGPDLWPYSDYLAWIGKGKGELVDKDFLQTYFMDSHSYEQRVSDYLTSITTLPDGLRAYLEYLEK